MHGNPADTVRVPEFVAVQDTSMYANVAILLKKLEEKNKNTPDSIKARFKEIATKNNLTRGSVNKSKFMSRKAIKETKVLQDRVQKSSIAIDKKDIAIEDMDSAIDRMYSRQGKLKTARARARMQEKINRLEKKKTILEKEKEMLERDHADFTKEYDMAVQRVEELSMFETKQTTGTTPIKETYPEKKIKM